MKRIREIANKYRATIDTDSVDNADSCAIILDLPKGKVWVFNGESSILSSWSEQEPAGKEVAIKDVIEQAKYGTREIPENQ